MSNPRNPEFPGDRVGRPADEEEIAVENFGIWGRRREMVSGLPNKEDISTYLPEGTTIWPEGKGRGKLLEDVLVERIHKRVRGLTGCKLVGSAVYWQFGRGERVILPRNTRVGVYSEDIKRRRGR